MEFIRDLTQLRPRHRGCVATIGNFDGVHRGHQAVLAQLKERAKALSLPALVIIFEPQPLEYFAPTRAPARLTRLREKLMIMARYGVEKVLCVRFSAQFAELTAEAFIEQLLFEKLAVHHLVVGDDFRFGQERQGHFKTLQAAGQRYGFIVEDNHTIIIDQERVSSTRIRHALEQGNMVLAEKLLGRPYTLCGRVRHGEQRGRSIGFPTANIFLHRRFCPIKGVFAVFVHGIAQKAVAGVANLGTRPTVDGQQLLLEVHLFDFNQTLYGNYVEVEFVSKLRDEKRFASFIILKEQIQKDALMAKTILSVKSAKLVMEC
jgi:riboflavin kinase/FMN adenylyltransferase